MADTVKWIKITTDMFDDEKIDFITSLPEADAIIVIWIRLLSLAGKCNAGGYIYLTEKIPYTDDMLSHKFRKPITIIKLALNTLQKLGMIEYDDEVIFITNWVKHQNVEGLEKIRERDKERKRKERANKKQLLIEGEMSMDSHGTVVGHPQTDIDKDLDIDIDKEKEYIPYREIIFYLNEKTGSKYKVGSSKTRELINARWNDKFTLDDFKIVIDKKVASWTGTDQEKYLRPETLFGNKFEGYLNEKVTKGGTNFGRKPNEVDKGDSRPWETDPYILSIEGRGSKE